MIIHYEYNWTFAAPADDYASGDPERIEQKSKEMESM